VTAKIEGRDNRAIVPNDKPCRHCGCCNARWHWSKTRDVWQASPCNSCMHAKERHGFVTHNEYDSYLASGCWVCGVTAYGIDHDHSICSKLGHSCERCRRGPICNRCNTTLKADATPARLRAKAAWYQEQSDRELMAAEALERIAA